MTRRSARAAVVAFGLLAGPLAHADLQAQSQGSGAEELRLEVHASGARLGGDNGGSGGGYGGVLSYTPSAAWGVFGGLDRVSLDDGTNDYTLQHLDAGIRVMPRAGRLQPVVTAGYTWRTVSYQDILFMGETTDVKVSGGGITLGAGVQYALTDRIGFDVHGLWSGGSIRDINVGNGIFRNEAAEFDAASMRLNVGASILLLRR